MKSFNDFWNEICTYKLEIAHPHALYKQNYKESNGCGAKGGVKVPDHLVWLYITTACNIHDIEWHLAKHRTDLILANQRFRRNMEKIVDQDSANWFMVRLRRRIAYRYYTEVKMIGTNAEAEKRGFV